MAVDDSNTKILLHMDGADTSTTFTDESGKTWTANGNAQIKTAQSVYGGASGNAAPSVSTADYIDTPDHADFNRGAGDFTIDLRLRIASVSGSIFIANQRGGAGNDAWTFSYSTTPDLRFNYTSDGTNFLGPATFSWSPSVDTWYHIELARDGSNLRCFVDGTQIGSTYNISTTSLFNSTATFKIFGDGINTTTYNAFIDEFRFSDVARHTANFTPPTSAYAPAVTFIPSVRFI